ncbi:hypothetical protein [Burkholderia phage FLC9]|nr:hypothetical protein [Burkholderia phage FLC9]
MSTENKEKMSFYQGNSITAWLKQNTYLGHAQTVQAIMETIAALCIETKVNPAFVRAEVEDQYAATQHHRGLKIMTVSRDMAPSPMGRIALLTAIPDGNMTEYIIAGRLIQTGPKLSTEKLRGIGVDPIEEGGGGLDWDEFRLWLNLSGDLHTGEFLRREIEAYLIGRNLTNLPLRFRQGNYRRSATAMDDGQIKIDIVLPPDGDRLATMKLHTEKHERYNQEILVGGLLDFEFNEDAFIKPEEARNMQVQQAENTNMVSVGKGLDYLRMYEPLDKVLKYTEFIEFLKANMPETIVDDFDKHMFNLDVENMFDSFRFKDVNHPSLDALTKGEDAYGEIVFECGKDGKFTNMDISFILGGQKKFGDMGWYEAIVGWPEGATKQLLADQEGKKPSGEQQAAPEAKEGEPTQPMRPPRDQIRMSLFATNGNARKSDGYVRKLSTHSGMMDKVGLLNMFVQNSTNKEHLDSPERIEQLIFSSPATQGDPARVRYFATIPLHADLARVISSNATDDGIVGYLDVSVVEDVPSRPGEYRQIGLFNFTTRAVQLPPARGASQTPMELIDTYIHPDTRGTTSVSFDADQPYGFIAMADLFKAFDKIGADNLLKYQASVRGIIKRLYGKEVGPNLHMKLVRVANPVLRASGKLDAGKITVKVFDTYLAIDEETPLLTFDLITGLTSDHFMNRNVEMIQGVVCQAEEELDKRTKEAREQARVETLQAIKATTSGPAVDDDHQHGVDGIVKHVTPTTFKTGSYQFFMGTIQGVLPLLSEAKSQRLHDFMECVTRSIGDTMTPAEFEFVFTDDVELVIDIKEADGSLLHFGLKL